MFNGPSMWSVLLVAQSAAAPVVLNATYTLNSPIQPSDGLPLVEILWPADPPSITGPDILCKWRDLSVGSSIEVNGTWSGLSRAACPLPFVNGTVRDFLLAELALNGSWSIRHEDGQPSDFKTVRVFDVNTTASNLTSYPVTMPDRSLPIVDSGYGLQTVLVITGPFSPFVGTWSLGCGFDRISDPQREVLVEGRLNGNFTELECLLPYNYSRHQYAPHLHVIAMDSGEELARLSGASPLPLSTEDIFTVLGAAPRWGLVGLNREVAVSGRGFPLEGYVGLLCHFESLGYTRALRINDTAVSCPTPEKGQSPGVDSRLTILYDVLIPQPTNWRPSSIAASLTLYPTASYDQFEVPSVRSFAPSLKFLYTVSHNNTRDLRLIHSSRLPPIMLLSNSLWCEFSPSLGSPTPVRVEDDHTVYCPVPVVPALSNITAISVLYRINGTHVYQPRYTSGAVVSFDIVARARIIRLIKNSSVTLQQTPACGPPGRFVAEAEAVNVAFGEDSCSVVLSPFNELLPGRLTALPSGTYQCNAPMVLAAGLQQRLESFNSNSSNISAHVVIGKVAAVDLQMAEVRSLLLDGIAEVPVSIARGVSNQTAPASPLALTEHAARLLHEKCADGSWDVWRRASRRLAPRKRSEPRQEPGHLEHPSGGSRRRLLQLDDTSQPGDPSKSWLKHNVSIEGVIPDWSFNAGGETIVLTGRFVPPTLFNFSGLLVNFGRGGPRVAATVINESAINCTVPAMPDDFFETVQLSVTVVFQSPFNNTHVNLTADGPGLLFRFLPNLALGSLSPRAGPPGGLTSLTMRVMFYTNFSSGLERDLGLDLDCAVGSTRTPATFQSVDQPGLPQLAMNRSYEVSCAAPMAGPRRDVCVQLVPRGARYIMNPTQPCNNTAGLHRLSYNYYRQVPRVDRVAPAVGLFEGGAAVVVSGKNFPSNATFPDLPPVLCKFDIYTFEGTRLDNSSVLCEAPAVAFSCNTTNAATGCPTAVDISEGIGVPVTVSFNGGRDWSYRWVPAPDDRLRNSSFSSSVNFTYAARSSIISVSPTFGPVTGGTRLTVSVATRKYSVRNLCIGDQVVPVTSKASDGGVGITQYEGIVPPLQRNGTGHQLSRRASVAVSSGTTNIEVWTVGVSAMQDDGRCFMGEGNFTYVGMWTVDGVEPAQGVFQDLRDPAALLISGNNFYMHDAALCRLSLSMMVDAGALGGSVNNTPNVSAGVPRYGDTSKRALNAFLSQRACDIEVPARVIDWNRLMCGPEFGVDFIDRTIASCGGDLLAAALSSEPRYLIALSSLSMSISVALNGVDYAAATTFDAGKAWGLFYSVFLAPQIVGVMPSRGPDAGGYPIRLEVTGSVAWRVTSCRFQPAGESEGTPLELGAWVDVPATPISDREITCVAPRWHIVPGQSTADVNLSLEISKTLWTNVTKFTYLKSPGIKYISPAEGPFEGGTRVAVYGEGFHLYGPDSAEGQGMSISCIFGRSVVAAHYVSPSEIFCYAPPRTASSSMKAGHYVNLDLTLDYDASHPSLRIPSVPMMSLHQQLFYYRVVRFSITYANPLSGPRTGGTLVSAYSDEPFLNTGLLRCGFGGQLVAAQRVSPFRIDCSTPSVGAPGPVPLSLSADNQSLTELTVIDAETQKRVPLLFTYYIQATVASVSPSFGSSEGGTTVLLQGSHFVDSSDLSCRFGTTVVTATRFISPSAILCESPAHQVGPVVVSVANNGQDFASGTGTVYTYMNSKPAFIIAPFLGPISGNTRVTVRTAGQESIPAHIWRAASSSSFCSFGTLKVKATVDAESASLLCVSPETVEPGEVPLLVSLNGQDTVDATQKYFYYSPPFITLVEPSMGPHGQVTYITLTGSNFYNTDMLTVMFGGVSADGPSTVFEFRRAIWLSNSQIQVDSPELSPTGELRVPLYVSNNGQNFSPEGIDTWDADDDSHDEPKSMSYYTFHMPVTVRSVSPHEGNMHGGGLVSVHGGPFLRTPNLLCSFDWIYVDPTVARPIVVSATQVLCPVPDMWEARSATALSRSTALRVTLNGIDWSLSHATFTFLAMSPPGYVTHHADQSVFTAQIRPCPPGYMCEEGGLSHPLPCPPGSYQPRAGSRQCIDCPKGYYCPLTRMNRPVVCPAGWVCDEEGLMTPYKGCPAGFICLEGTATGSAAPVQTTLLESNNPGLHTAGSNAPKLCPRGLHCYPGTLALRSSPGNLSTPQPCFQGFFCPPGSSHPYGAGACPPGKYCPVPRSSGIVCKPRFKCGPMPGQVEPTECPAGTFNPYHGQHNCTLCHEGGICPLPLMDRPKPAECGYVAARKGIKVHSGNDLCPAGRVCGWAVASVTEPKICTTLSPESTVNISSPEESCLPELGQAFVPRERFRSNPLAGRVANSWNQSLGLCCWDSSKVMQFLSGVALYYEGLRVPLLDEARAAWTVVEKVRRLNEHDRLRDSAAAGFDGLEMLLNFTDDSLRLSWRLHLSRVRQKILLDIARHYFFKGPEPCPKGSFCNRGTCEDLMAVISDSGQTASRRRRLTTVNETRSMDGTARRKALPDDAIEYTNLPKADLVRMSSDEQGEAMVQLGVVVGPRSTALLEGIRVLQADAEEVQQISLPPNHPLALRAPQQCLAGTYCNARANSSLGTGLCPTGMYCSSGASEPSPAPEGEFVGEIGRVRGRMCTPGKFAPNPSSPICYPCPPGYSCPDFGTRTPFLCARGTFRQSSGDEAGSVFDDETPVVVGESQSSSDSSISCSPCVAGTWAVLRGTEDETGCDPCPVGRFCLAKTGNVSETNPCPEGNICGEGTTLETASKTLCFDGFYCGPGTSPTSVYKSLCLKEFYCPEGTTYANRYNFRCPTGFYCPPGTGWKPDMDVPLRPNSAYVKYNDFLVLQVAAQFCLRQLHAAEYKYIQATNEANRRSGLSDEMSVSEVEARLSKWTSSLSSCVHSQVQYIPFLATAVEGVAKGLYDEELWHSERMLSLQQLPWKPPYEYSNKCLNQTYPRLRQGTTWDCLCREAIADGRLMRCLTRATDPYDEPYGAPFRYDTDSELGSGSCSPWPDCIDWTRVSQDNIGGSPGPEGGPYWDDFDRLAVPFIDYVREALEREMKRTATDIDENGESKQSRTRCPFGTLTSEDAVSELDLCVKRKSIVHLQDNADIIISRVNPVAMANVESVPRPIPASKQGTIIPVIDDEDERIVYSLPARASAIITLDLRHVPSGVEYGRDWRIRVLANDTLPHDFEDSQVCEDIWTRWYLDKELYFGSLADVREDNLRAYNCTMVDMPVALERFMMASSSLCPSITDPLCVGFGFTQSISTTACRGGQDHPGQPKVIELELHALVDIQFRVEVQILNGMVMSDRFSYIRTTSVEVLQPSRNVLGTSSAFVMELRHDSGVALPFNTPLAAPGRVTTNLDVKYDDLEKQSSVSGVVALSQRGILSKALLSWLPRKEALTNCMRHPADYDEYLWAGNYFTSRRKTLWMSHLPFFSNCRGFGRAIPLWQVVEHGEKCRIVDEEDTVGLVSLS